MVNEQWIVCPSEIATPSIRRPTLGGTPCIGNVNDIRSWIEERPLLLPQTGKYALGPSVQGIVEGHANHIGVL